MTENQSGRPSVLFLGGAKRVTMARMFRKAAQRLDIALDIISYELEPDVPVASEARIVTGLKWRDPGVVEDLCALIKREGVIAVVPFVDGAVEIAKLVADKSGIYAPVGRAESAAEMFDKATAAEIFEKVALPIPATYRPGMAPEGLIAKPRRGSASKGIFAIDSAEDLERALKGDAEYLIQKRIDRREEYTVDCYRTVGEGKTLVVSPRRRVETLGGEVTRTVTVDDARLRELASRCLEAVDLRGAVTVQLIRDLDMDEIMIMEVNPRLGGGAVCSVYAGADIPSLILLEALGFEAEPLNAKPGVEVARYFADTVFDNGRVVK